MGLFFKGAAGLPVEAPRTPRVKQSLLKWWAIFPASIFMGVEAIFARKPATNPGMDDGASIGYVVGGCLFGLVLSLLLAWVAYRLTRRSQLVATLMFSFVLGFVGCGTIVSTTPEAAARRAQLADPVRRN